MLELGNEYTKRYGKEHLSITKCKWILWERPYGIPSNGFTQPPQAMPDEYKDPCSVQAYWNYYIGDKFNIAHKDETIYKTRPLCAAS
jgi:hypothetical protein